VGNLNETFIQRNNRGGFQKINAAASNYNNTNNVYAAYTTYTNSYKKFGYQLGLRAERSNYTGELLTTGDKFENNYPISLFPSVFLSQKLKGDQQVQLNFSRRINRPNFFQLIPFTDRTDPLNITRGNPDLVPEFTNSLRLRTVKHLRRIITFLLQFITNALTILLPGTRKKNSIPF
jgi:outer membrane receptor protein involved in Fe transport